MLVCIKAKLLPKTIDQMDKRLQTELQCATFFLLAKGEQGLMHAVSSNRKGYRTKDEFLRDIDSVYDHELAIEQINELTKIYAKEKKLPDLQARFRDFADKDSKQYKIFHDSESRTVIDDCVKEYGDSVDGLSRIIMFRIHYKNLFRQIPPKKFPLRIF